MRTGYAERPAEDLASPVGAHAIVIGAGIAGLTAARVLAERFDRVTIVDRDTMPAACVDRAGIPQGSHGHGLLASGLQALTRLFPGVDADLTAAGAVGGDVIGDIRWFQHGHYKMQFDSGRPGFLMSRALLEGVIRARVRRLPNVVIADGHHVIELRTDPAVTRIIGVRTSPDLGGNATADLVIDASGRSSRTPTWLPALGFGSPRAERIDIELFYATRQFARSSTDLDGDSAAIIAATPPRETRLGFMLAVEHDRWMVTLGGVLGVRPPTDPRGYLDYARSLPAPDIYEVIRDAAPLSEVATFRFAGARRYRYEKLRNFPDGYVVLGDAACSFNPLYGQGMSVAALEALDLQACLAERPALEGLWRRISRRVARRVARAWMLAATGDLAYPGVAGRRAIWSGAVNWYLGQLHRAAAHDREVCRTFFDVAGLVAPPAALFSPRVAMRVARYRAASRP